MTKIVPDHQNLHDQSKSPATAGARGWVGYWGYELAATPALLGPSRIFVPPRLVTGWRARFRCTYCGRLVGNGHGVVSVTNGSGRHPDSQHPEHMTVFAYHRWCLARLHQRRREGQARNEKGRLAWRPSRFTIMQFGTIRLLLKETTNMSNIVPDHPSLHRGPRLEDLQVGGGSFVSYWLSDLLAHPELLTPTPFVAPRLAPNWRGRYRCVGWVG